MTTKSSKKQAKLPMAAEYPEDYFTEGFEIDSPEDEHSYLAPKTEHIVSMSWWAAGMLALAIFCGGLAVNLVQMAVDYEVTMYTSNKFMRWQEDQIKQYEQQNPGSHPSTKDFHGHSNNDFDF